MMLNFNNKFDRFTKKVQTTNNYLIKNLGNYRELFLK